MKVSIVSGLLYIVSLVACTSEIEYFESKADQVNSSLSIHVRNSNYSTKGLVTSEYLSSGSEVGITVTNTSGGNYDGTAYNNIKFTASGTNSSQTWAGASAVKLSATDGYCYAYYPYSSTANKITAIPVSAGGTDYLYASRVTVNDKSSAATLVMKHALSAIRLSLVKGSYVGTGKVTAVSVASSGLGKSGTLNATTGVVTASSLNTSVSQTSSITLSSTAQNVDVVMVPSGTAGTINITATIDGNMYSTSIASTLVEQGKLYTYSLSANTEGLSLIGATVGEWTYISASTYGIPTGKYTISYAGDYADMAFSNQLNTDGSAVIKVVGTKPDSLYPNEVTITGSATLNQSVEGNVRIIRLSQITSNVTVTFNGFVSPWVSLPDGVYAIDKTGKPVEYSIASTAASGTYQGVAFVIKGKAYQVAKVDVTGDWLGYDNDSTVVWDRAGYNDPRTLTFYTKPCGTNSFNNLAEATPDPYTWIDGGLSDFNGQDNTAAILASQINGAGKYSVSKGIVDFRSGSNNEGKDDWFLPSFGELAYMFLKKTELNTLLGKIDGGTVFTCNDYWSSTYYSDRYVWYLNLSDGNLGALIMSLGIRVRLVRAI